MSMWRKKARGGEVPEPVKSDTVLSVLHPGRWDTQLADLNWYLEDGQPVFDSRLHWLRERPVPAADLSSQTHLDGTG